MADYIQLVIPGLEPYLDTMQPNKNLSYSDSDTGKEKGKCRSDRSPKSPIPNHSKPQTV